MSFTVSPYVTVLNMPRAFLTNIVTREKSNCTIKSVLAFDFFFLLKDSAPPFIHGNNRSSFSIVFHKHLFNPDQRNHFLAFKSFDLPAEVTSASTIKKYILISHWLMYALLHPLQTSDFFPLLLHIKVAKIHLYVKGNEEKKKFLHSFTWFLVS